MNDSITSLTNVKTVIDKEKSEAVLLRTLKKIAGGHLNLHEVKPSFLKKK